MAYRISYCEGLLRLAPSLMGSTLLTHLESLHVLNLTNVHNGAQYNNYLKRASLAMGPDAASDARKVLRVISVKRRFLLSKIPTLGA